MAARRTLIDLVRSWPRWWPAVPTVVVAAIVAGIVWRSGADDADDTALGPPPGEDLPCRDADGDSMGDMECEAIGEISEDVRVVPGTELELHLDRPRGLVDARLVRRRERLRSVS